MSEHLAHMMLVAAEQVEEARDLLLAATGRTLDDWNDPRQRISIATLANEVVTELAVLRQARKINAEPAETVREVVDVTEQVRRNVAHALGWESCGEYLDRELSPPRKPRIVPPTDLDNLPERSRGY